MARPGFKRGFLSDARGLAAVEFALIAPVFIVLMLGVLDMGHSLYMQSVLQGVIQKAARDSALETGTEDGTQASIDANLTARVQNLAKGATVHITRRYYKTFTTANARTPETFTDGNGDHVCDNNESYQDANGNGTWDADGADGGQGGAKDIVVYTADISYARLFPLSGLMGLSRDVTMEAKTVIANQPYGEQAQYTAPVFRNCP
jgi:Flp pilus assembly protein TadG